METCARADAGFPKVFEIAVGRHAMIEAPWWKVEPMLCAHDIDLQALLADTMFGGTDQGTLQSDGSGSILFDHKDEQVELDDPGLTFRGATTS